ncbi:Pupal cuticle protein Edg-78E [Armadillidium vulgare]|nr:Pupal cuticle protein Edg-78E [Armadillidium vulgare]
MFLLKISLTEKKEKTNLQTLSERLELSIKDKSDEDGIHSIETDLKENKNSTSDEKINTSVESAISKEDADDDDALEEKNIDHLRNYFYPERGYVFEYTSDDGTRRKELAKKEEDTGLLEKEGEVSFTFPTGEDYKLTYTAGKEGYKPSSSWLPVAPVFPHPIPAFVLRQIEEAKRKAEENGSSEERSQQALRKAFNLS